MKTFFKIFIISFIVFALKIYSDGNKSKTRWGEDILVRGGNPTMGIDWDEDEVTGYLYAVLDSSGYDSDHAEIYRSTDNGQTWSLWYRPALVNDSSVTNPRIRVVRDAGDTSWVCVFGIWCEHDGNDELWMRAFRADDPATHFEYAVDNYVDYYDVESDKGDSAYIYVTYIKNNYVMFARNNLSGAWQDNIALFNNPGSDPSPQVATNSRGDVGVCFVDTSQSAGGRDEIRLVRSKDKGLIWLPVQQVGANTGYHGISELDIAYSQDTTQTVWITNTWTVVGNRRVGYFYSTDTSATWNYGGILTGPPSAEEYDCNIRTNRSTGNLALLYTGDLTTRRSVAYSYSSDTDPDSVDEAIYINDDSLSEIARAPAIVGWTENGPAVMYVDYGENNVYFDTLFYISGIDEDGEDILSIKLDNSILTSKGTIARYSVPGTGMVNMNLFNVNGQIVRRILNSVQTPGTYEINLDYEGLGPGVYILRLETTSGNACRKTILIE
jgi:hypothetical protein